VAGPPGGPLSRPHELAGGHRAGAGHRNVGVVGAGERFGYAPLLSRLKQCRAVACLDKRELIYEGTVDVASIRIWLRDPVP
jgi:hypothetical protein